MSLDDSTRDLVQEIKLTLTCPIPNSEGKAQPHDWSDTYQRWTWSKLWPRRLKFRKCIRCGKEVQRVRRIPG